MQKLHPKVIWKFFIQNLIGYLISCGCLGFFIFLFFSSLIQKSMIREIVIKGKGWIIPGILLYIGFCYLWAKLSYQNWHYELGEDAIKIEKGIIWKKYISIPYNRIQNIDIYRGVIDRLLGLSDLQIQTAGYGAAGASGVGSEGRLPGLAKDEAEKLREELVKRSKRSI